MSSIMVEDMKSAKVLAALFFSIDFSIKIMAFGSQLQSRLHPIDITMTANVKNCEFVTH